jgi:hypothetical protein
MVAKRPGRACVLDPTEFAEFAAPIVQHRPA